MATTTITNVDDNHSVRTAIQADLDPESFNRLVFKHDPLALHNDSIRLLTVSRNLSSSGLIQCTIKHIQLPTSDGKAIQYKALSYVWGEPNHERTILINGAIFKVRKNLFDFLSRYRLRMSRVSVFRARPWLWIDALCIDQANTLERNHQVQMMRRIYQAADEVMIWLGRGDCELEDFLACLELQSDRKWQRRTLDTRIVPTLLERLTKLEYWSRAWIVQEFVLARSRSIYYGNNRCSWDAISEYLDPFIRLDNSHRSGFNNIVIALNHESCQASLFACLEYFIGLDCSEARDRIYALVGTSTFAQHFPVDYDCSSDELFINTASYCLMEVQHLSTDHAGANLSLSKIDISNPSGFLPFLGYIRSVIPDYDTPAERSKQCHLKLFPFNHRSVGGSLAVAPADSFGKRFTRTRPDDQDGLPELVRIFLSGNGLPDRTIQSAARAIQLLANATGFLNTWIVVMKEQVTKHVWLMRQYGEAQIIAGSFSVQITSSRLGLGAPNVHFTLELYGEGHLAGLMIREISMLRTLELPTSQQSHWLFSDVRPVIVLFGLPTDDSFHRRRAIRLMGDYDHSDTYRNTTWITTGDGFDEYVLLESWNRRLRRFETRVRYMSNKR